ncbi:hypothetical protein [Martelella sp. FOR1707]
MEYSECQASLGCISLMAPILGLMMGTLYIFLVVVIDIGQANLRSYYRAVIAVLLPWVEAPKDTSEKNGHLRYALRPVLGAIAMMATTMTFLFLVGSVSDRIFFSAALATSLLAVGTLASKRAHTSFSVKLKWPSRGFEWRIYPIASLVWHLRAGLWCALFYWFMRFAQQVDL